MDPIDTLSLSNEAGGDRSVTAVRGGVGSQSEERVGDIGDIARHDGGAPQILRRITGDLDGSDLGEDCRGDGDGAWAASGSVEPIGKYVSSFSS